MNSTPEPANEQITWRWHDNLIYGLSIKLGDIRKQDWKSDLVFDIDHIVEWICCSDGAFRFRVAPATLTFHHAGDLEISVDHGYSAGRNALSHWAINSVLREPVGSKVEMWRWSVMLSMPANGRISFSSSGFSQVLRAEPKLVEEQHLPFGCR